MEVHFYATLREIVGGKSKTFDLPPSASARQLLLEVTNRYPELHQKLINKNGDLYNYVHYFINGRDVRYLEAGMDTILNPDDVVSMFPAVGGG
jgi:molybdopterin synthase sulfur carrier subunit